MFLFFIIPFYLQFNVGNMFALEEEGGDVVLDKLLTKMSDGLNLMTQEPWSNLYGTPSFVSNSVYPIENRFGGWGI